MLLSLKKLKEFVNFDLNLEELDDVLTMLGIEVESVTDYSKKYDKFFTAHVLSCEKHPKADKLTVCQVDFGNEIATVVCGAPNVAQGQKVVLGTIGGVVPNGGFKLEKRKIRDIVSSGMICSQTELDLGEDTGGIWVLPEETPVGLPVAQHFGLDDIVLELGLTPNKSDCLSYLGIARELAAKLNLEIKLPKSNLVENNIFISEDIKIEIIDAEKCERYAARVIRNVEIKESPAWLQKELKLIGLRPVNAPVDVTNLVMFELGQPLHAFDYDKISDQKIIVRSAKEGEAFTTLDGKERKLNDFMVVIADSEKAIALGGVMGGQNTEITKATQNILLESAYFNPSTIRKTAKVLALASDSSYRFERGTDIEGITRALDRAALLIAEICGGEISKGIMDIYPDPKAWNKIEFRFARARKIIGIEIENDVMLTFLKSLGFGTEEINDEYAIITVPPRRNDIFGEIDLIEEIARMYNYDNITPNYVSSINFSGKGVHPKLATPPMRDKLRDYFVASGFTEILTQNMIDPKSAGIFTENPVEIANPLGVELSRLRPSMVPSILKTIDLNLRHGNQSLKIFEIGKVFNHSDKKNNLLAGFEETEMLQIALVGKSTPKQWALPEKAWDFYDIKGLAEDFNEFFNLSMKFDLPNENNPAYSANCLAIKANGKEIGYFGAASANILKQFDLDTPVLLLELNLTVLFNLDVKVQKYKPFSPFPTVNRDLAFLLDESINSGDVRKIIAKIGGGYLKKVEVFDFYAGKNLPEGKKSLAYSLSFSAPDRTLLDEDIDPAIEKIIKEVEKVFSAELRKV